MTSLPTDILRHHIYTRFPATMQTFWLRRAFILNNNKAENRIDLCELAQYNCLGCLEWIHFKKKFSLEDTNVILQ